MKAGILFSFALMLTFRFQDSSYPTLLILASILNFTGHIGLLIWLYAICQKSAEILKKQQIEFNEMKTYKISAFGFIVSIILLHILSFIDPETLATQNDLERGETFTYSRIYFSTALIFLIGFVLMYANTMKLLLSVETGKEQSFSDYSKSFLFLLFLPWIAVWYIQPRVKNIEKTGTNSTYP
ncbi:MAG: hypothetical protein ACK4ZJ_13775 [Allorhizobium sp.]